MSLNVKELRLQYGLSQQDLADATGIPKGRINSWEQKGSAPKFNDHQKLMEFFARFENKDVPRGTLPKANDRSFDSRLIETQEKLIAKLEEEVKLLRDELTTLKQKSK